MKKVCLLFVLLSVVAKDDCFCFRGACPQSKNGLPWTAQVRDDADEKNAGSPAARAQSDNNLRTASVSPDSDIFLKKSTTVGQGVAQLLEESDIIGDQYQQIIKELVNRARQKTACTKAVECRKNKQILVDKLTKAIGFLTQQKNLIVGQ